MCGIAGIFNVGGQSSIDKKCLLVMTRLVRHRGPDDEGFFLVNTQTGDILSCSHDETIASVKRKTKYLFGDFQANLGLGFRRLSILDTSEKGHQPMVSKDGRYAIVYNGEVYNYMEIRRELEKEGWSFFSRTDTEVVLNAYRQWGPNCLKRFNGMWAFAIWDNQNHNLFCARDRFGIKPFYYYFNSSQFIFASETKQILACGVDKTINEKMIYRSLKIGSFIAYKDETFFENIKSLPQGHFLNISDGHLTIEKYYDLNPLDFEKSKLNLEDATLQYLELFNDSVKKRIVSDVSVGSCLSGGLDSSAIVAMAARNLPYKLQTFSAYYNLGIEYDERKWMKIVGEQCQTDMHFISPAPNQMLDDLDWISFVNDFPVMSPSQISQYYVMKLAKINNTTVLLDGQGSDEITGGYNHSFYRYYADLLKKYHFKTFLTQYPDYLRFNQKGNSFSRLIKTIYTLFSNESSIYQNEAKHLLINPLSKTFNEKNIFTNIQDLQTSKLSNFLYNLLMSGQLQSLLHYEDRNSMAHSIEARVPFLDYRLVEFAFSLPSHYKIHKNYGKYIHRQALKRIVPIEIAQRKDKVNFRSPAATLWLKNELRPFVESVINSTSFKQRPIYDHKLIHKIYQNYLKGDNRYYFIIWRIIMLEKWLNLFIDTDDYLLLSKF